MLIKVSTYPITIISIYLIILYLKYSVWTQSDYSKNTSIKILQMGSN